MASNSPSRPQIVVLDAFPSDSGDMDWTPFHELGELVLHQNTTPEELIPRIAHAQIVLTNKVKLPAEVLQSAPELKLISVLSTGYDVIDIEAARSHGVTVCNIPGYSTASTAQTTVALLLELCHHVGAHNASVKAGDWTRSPVYSYWNFPLVELQDKTLVLVGTGSIGTRVGEICAAMGMKVISAQLPGRASKTEAPFPRLPLHEALPQADVVSLHCPLTPETRGLVNAESLAVLKPSAFLLNSSRGGLIEESALAAALHDGKLAGFAGDVLSVEPPPASNPLLGAPHCLLTPHIAWASTESRARLIAASGENVRAFLAGSPQNVVS